MEEDQANSRPHQLPSSSSSGDAGASTSSSSPPEHHHEELEATATEVQVQVHQPDDDDDAAVVADNHNHRRSHRYRRRFPRQEFPRRSVTYRVNVAVSNLAPTDMREDIWSCLAVLVTFWFFASMTLILGFYGSYSFQLGPNCSQLITANEFFVQSIQATQTEGTSGPMLYGFHTTPSLDSETEWSEAHNASVQPNYHKEWLYYLNAGSKVDISYNVKNSNSSSLSLVVAQGEESLIEWIEDPSYANTTLSWNIVYGSGSIEQEISTSDTYYIAVGNLNSNTLEVELNLTIKAVLYNTTQAYYRCSLYDHACSFSLWFLKKNAVIITSPGPDKVKDDEDLYIKLSYGPRWLTYILGSGILTVALLLLFRFCNMFQSSQGGGSGAQAGTGADNQEPLIPPKDDDLSSWGSSYDSVSNDEEDLDEWLQEQGKQPKDGENSANPRKLCVICFDSPRDCFFLPCGHCAACFTCGSRIAEEAGTCPICRKRMKKVRKIFSV